MYIVHFHRDVYDVVVSRGWWVAHIMMICSPVFCSPFSLLTCDVAGNPQGYETCSFVRPFLCSPVKWQGARKVTRHAMLFAPFFVHL